MSIITISSIFNDYNDYVDFCNDTVVADFIDTTTFETTLTSYVYNPIWLRYKDTPIKFSNDDKGKDAFLRNFYNQLSEVVFDFHNYAKENIEYFLYQNDITKQGKPMSKTITSGIAPINQTIDQEVDSTNLASGTGSQFVSETVYNGIAWHKLVEGYFTPNRKTEMLKAFQWLFISVYSPETKYDDKIEEKRYVELSFVDEDNNIIDEQKVLPTKSYYTMSEVNIQRPLMLDPQNIKKDVDIAGVIGTLESQIYPRIYDLLRLDSPDGVIIYNTPSGYDGIEGVEITIPNTAVPENIKDGVNIGGIIGTYIGTIDYLEKRISGNELYDYTNNNITELNAQAFEHDYNIRTFSSSSVTSFNSSGYVFSQCPNLTSVSLPGITSEISQHFINLCANFTTLYAPNATKIGSYAVFSCNGFITATFESCTNLASNAIRSCSNFTILTLPVCDTIGQSAIYSCANFSDLYLGKNDGICALSNVNGIPASSTQHITVHVPSSLISTYQTATNWSTLYNNGYITFVAI